MAVQTDSGSAGSVAVMLGCVENAVGGRGRELRTRWSGQPISCYSTQANTVQTYKGVQRLSTCH